MFYLNPITTFLAISSSIIHEIGHIVAIFFYKFNVRKIELGVFNFIIDSNISYKLSEKYNDFVFLAGPIANFCIIIVMHIFTLQNQSYIAQLFYIDNLLLCLLNILPINGLDGGNILYIFLTKKFGDVLAYKISNIISFFIIFPLALAGIYILVKSSYNCSLLILMLCLIYNSISKK